MTMEEADVDEVTFPRFAQLLRATRGYRELSGSRFRLACFAEGTAPEAQTPRLRGQLEAAQGATPVVQDFARRLQAGEQGLCEELERASRIVMAECVRNAVVTHCRRLELWPPPVTPLGVEDQDCAYEDLSAPLDVVAQRAFNDERRRGGAAKCLAQRALTASYLVDFAQELAVPLPAVPETFASMLSELELRSAEWEQQYGPAGSPKAAVGTLDEFLLAEPSCEPKETLELVLEGAMVFGLECLAGEEASQQRLYLELELGGASASTSVQLPKDDEPGIVAFEEIVLPFAEAGELGVRVRRRDRLRAVLSGDALLGEAILPLGPELQDRKKRNISLPLSLAESHAGTVSLGMSLRGKQARTSRLSHIAATSAGVGESAGSFVVALGATVNSVVDLASGGVGLRHRKGYGTCRRELARAIVVTEEGPRRCCCYAYASREEAEAYFNARSWRLTSRILFRARGGCIVEELLSAGPLFAHATIRRTAWLELSSPPAAVASGSASAASSAPVSESEQE